MKKVIKIFLLLAFILLMVNSSFAISAHLLTEEITESDVKGVFTLILYGARDISLSFSVE